MRKYVCQKHQKRTPVYPLCVRVCLCVFKAVLLVDEDWNDNRIAPNLTSA